MVDAFAVVGEPDEIAGKLRSRFGDLFDRISFSAPLTRDDDALRAVISVAAGGVSRLRPEALLQADRRPPSSRAMASVRSVVVTTSSSWRRTDAISRARYSASAWVRKVTERSLSCCSLSRSAWRFWASRISGAA